MLGCSDGVSESGAGAGIGAANSGAGGGAGSPDGLGGAGAGGAEPPTTTGGAPATSGGTGGASGQGGSLADASIPEDADSGAFDAGLTTPQPVDPCGDDLAAQLGEIRPSFGAPAPGAVFTGDPNDGGAFDVLAIDVSIANPDPSREALDATFYAPSTDGGMTVAPGIHPLALVMHGFGTTHRNYEHFTRHLASHGLIVLGITLPFALTAAHDKNAQEAIAAIDYALGDDAPDAVRGRADAERIAALGHSFGGKIAFYAAAMDARIDLVVGWDPSNAGGPPCFIDAMACNQFPVAPNCLIDDSGIVHQLHAETLVLRAAPDGANPEPEHNAVHFYRGAPSPATLIDFDTSVAHGDFANPAAAVLPHTRRVHTAFLLSRLLSVSGLDDYLPGGSQIDADPRVARALSR